MKCSRYSSCLAADRSRFLDRKHFTISANDQICKKAFLEFGWKRGPKCQAQDDGLWQRNLRLKDKRELICTVNTLTDFAVAILDIQRVFRGSKLDSTTMARCSVLLVEALLRIFYLVWGLCLPVGCCSWWALVHSTSDGC